MPGADATIGFVGLGSIGRPMVENMLLAGLDVVVFDLEAGVMAELAALGARPAADLAELAAASSIVGVCVPADQHVRAVLDGPDGVLAHLTPGATVSIHSTVLPETVVWAADAAKAHGVTVVEAPVTGGFMAAQQGRSTFLLGGEPATFDAIEAILAACGEERIHAGGLGDASRLKLCINLQTYATFMGVAEAATLAKANGLSIDALKAAMRANGQLGVMTERYMILHDFSPETLADPSMQSTLEGYAAIIEKDLVLISQLAKASGVEVPAAELAGRRARNVYFLDDED